MSYLFAAVTLACVLATAHAEVACIGDQDCAPYPGTTCFKSVCTCGPNMVLVEEAKMCMSQSASESSPCKYSQQCQHISNNMNCIDRGGNNRVCGCDNGYQFLDGKCWFKVVLGGTCTNEYNCTVVRNQHRVHCLNSKCTCETNFPPAENNTTCAGVTLTSPLALVGLLVGASFLLGPH